MQAKFIEAHDATSFNWGKFAVCRFTVDEWAHRSEIDLLTTRGLLDLVGWTPDHLLVLDLQTGEGSIFKPGGYARADLNEKHQIWVCPMFEPFLSWLYKQDLADLDKLPALVDLGDVPTSMSGYRRNRAGEPFDWKKQLAEEMADATKLVWLFQRGLTEGRPMAELIAIANQLKGRADVVTGYLARWDLWEKGQSQGPAEE